MPQLAPYVSQLLMLQISLNAGVTPIRVQKTRLHWAARNVYFEATLLGAAPSLGKTTPRSTPESVGKLEV